MKKLLKNRTLMGVLCIVLSLLICFGLTPLFNRAITAQTEITRVKSDIKKGELITPDKLESITVGSYNLPANVLKKKEEISGKYALADLQKGDYVLSTKLSAAPLAEFEYLSALDGTKQAMSVTIKSFAAGLSGKLEAGDIVSLIATAYGDRQETALPPELQYVYVLAVTTGKGQDKEYTTNPKAEGDGQELPSTITVLVRPAQEGLLADLEAKSKLHVALVYRGGKEQAQKFLDAQDKYLAGLPKNSATLNQDLTVPETPALLNKAQGGNGQ
ncbi:Flp pilus assembly protein CpaB [Desulfosporosinus lacus]|uniref:Pilus assembly protein CpaB n=1 Tax=Desulfosporosinus lacus DSM 15449 TaxID=1121420 RepID=A0A1M5V2F0_9FIRM|nr:RcpC/CpaB family pilus assembly protein [Desulfosporosinus lacus]SHH69401.1 pilus assembly protein CpaB [Desulfosporosinus lacus DSM 15449]